MDTGPHQFGPGTFGCHEALDRCSMLADLADQLSEHPAIMLVPDWRRRAQEATKALADLYAEIGRIHLEAPSPDRTAEGKGE